MNARIERWHQVSELFDRVADLIPEERRRILDAECAHDPELRTEVERLLSADERTNPLDHDIAAQASALLLEGDPHEHEGECFGPYRIVKLLGQGGMGRVYLAQREGSDFTQTVALKLVGGSGSFDAALARRRFLDERRMLARLQHPHIARLLDGGVGPEAQPWFAMEYVDGAPLTEWCDAHKLGIPARLEMFAKVCDAVDHAHRFLIVHRDIKPGNVLVDERGEPKVLDFGIAKLLGDGDHARTGSTILMTPDYAAPEQIRGGQISTATDVYALGAVLFEVLTGRKPFADPLASREPPQASRVATEGTHTGERAQARGTTAQALRKRLRGDIDRILRTALDPDPARRYGSAATLAQDLRAVVAGQPISLRSDRAYRVGIFLRRHRLGVAAASAAILALLGTTGWALWQTRQAEEHARIATQQAGIAKREALASEKVSDLLVSAFEGANPNARKTDKEPTASDVLHAGAALVDKELADVPPVKARMQLVLGRAYANLGRPEQAAPLLHSAVDGYLSPSVDQPLQAAEALSVLVEAEKDMEHRDQAVVVARRSLELRRRFVAPSQELYDAYNILGMALINTTDYAEAASVLKTAHQLALKEFGDPSEKVAESLHNRGQLASVRGQVSESERLFREAYAMKLVLKKTARSLFGTRSLLAMALDGQGRLDEAEALLQQNLRIAPTIYPDDSEHLARLQSRIGEIYRDRGDLLRAETHYKNAIDMQTRITGPDLRAASYMLMLASILDARGDLKAAEETFAKANAIFTGDPLASEPSKLAATAKHGLFLTKYGKPGAARNGLEAVFDRWVASYEPPAGFATPWELVDAQAHAAQYHFSVGHLKKAEAQLPRADPTREQALVQARRQYWLARIRAADGDRAGAKAEFEGAIRALEAITGQGSAWAALWRLDYAELLLSAGMREQAKSQIELAEPALRKQMVPAAPSLSRLKQLRRATAFAH